MQDDPTRKPTGSADGWAVALLVILDLAVVAWLVIAQPSWRGTGAAHHQQPAQSEGATGPLGSPPANIRRELAPD